MGSDELGKDLRLIGYRVGGVNGPWVRSAFLHLHLEFSDGKTCDVKTDPIILSEEDVRKRMGILADADALGAMKTSIGIVTTVLSKKIDHMGEQAVRGIAGESRTVDDIKATIIKAKAEDTPESRKIAGWLEELLKRKGALK